MEPSPWMGPPKNMSGIQKLQFSLTKKKWNPVPGWVPQKTCPESKNCKFPSQKKTNGTQSLDESPRKHVRNAKFTFPSQRNKKTKWNPVPGWVPQRTCPECKNCNFPSQKKMEPSPSMGPPENMSGIQKLQFSLTKKMEPSPSMGPPENMSGIQKLQFSLTKKNKWNPVPGWIPQKTCPECKNCNFPSQKKMEPSPSMGPPENMSGIQKLQFSLTKKINKKIKTNPFLGDPSRDWVRCVFSVYFLFFIFCLFFDVSIWACFGFAFFVFIFFLLTEGDMGELPVLNNKLVCDPA